MRVCSYLLPYLFDLKWSSMSTQVQEPSMRFINKSTSETKSNANEKSSRSLLNGETEFYFYLTTCE